jgi:hypothetical protein
VRFGSLKFGGFLGFSPHSACRSFRLIGGSLRFARPGVALGNSIQYYVNFRLGALLRSYCSVQSVGQILGA